MRYLPLVLLLLLGLSHSAQAAPVSYAIIVGNNAPPERGATEEYLQPLHYADDDAIRYYQLFSKIGNARLFSVLDTNTQRRYPQLAALSAPPSLDNLLQAVADYASSMSADRARGDQPIFYFIFSGHGAQDKEGGSFLALEGASLTQDILYDEILARLPSTYSHVIVDACHAGGVVGIRGGFFADEVEGRTKTLSAKESQAILSTRRLARFPQVGVILASSLGQEAHEWSEVESGVFTHELLSGLLGPADVNRDEKIEYTEIQAFVAAANRNIKDPRAVPQIVVRAPKSNQNVALMSLAAVRSQRVLKGEFGKLGHFFLELENGQRYLDAHLSIDAKVSVIVLDSQRVFLRTDTQEAQLPPRKEVFLSDLKWSARRVAAKGSIDAAYRSALFSSPFGATYYQGYVDSIGAIGVSFPLTIAKARAQSLSETSVQKNFAIGLSAVAGLATLTAATTTVVAHNARSDYMDTDLQKPAHEARLRYERYRTVAIAASASALLAGAASWLLWPEAETTLSPSASGAGDYSLFLNVSW